MGRGPKLNKMKSLLSKTKYIWKPALDKLVNIGLQKAKKKFGPKHHINPLLKQGKKLLAQHLNKL